MERSSNYTIRILRSAHLWRKHTTRVDAFTHSILASAYGAHPIPYTFGARCHICAVHKRSNNKRFNHFSCAFFLSHSYRISFQDSDDYSDAKWGMSYSFGSCFVLRVRCVLFRICCVVPSTRTKNVIERAVFVSCPSWFFFSQFLSIRFSFCVCLSLSLFISHLSSGSALARSLRVFV